MKELEDKGWEAMSKMLDSSLPQKKRYFIKFWELLTLVGMTGIVIVMFNWNSIKNQINNNDVAANSTQISQNRSQNDVVATVISKDKEPALAHVEIEEKANQIGNSANKEIYGKSNSSQSKMGAGNKNYSINSPATQKENHGELITTKVQNIPGEKLSYQDKESDIIRNQNSNEVDNDTKPIMLNDLELNESPSISRTEASSLVLLPSMTMGNLSLVNPSIQTSLKINKNKFRSVGLYIKGGAFMASNSSYSGLFLSPELTYKIGKRSNLFVNGQARYKKTQSEIIYKEFASNVKTYIIENVGSITGSTEIPVPDKVNVNTFDIGLDLGYRISLMNRLSVGVFGFYRYNNLLDQVPVSEQNIPLFDPNYQTNFDAFQSVSSTITTYNPKYNYGVGLDLNYRLGSRSLLFSSVNRSFNGKQNYEINLGYGFRLF